MGGHKTYDQAKKDVFKGMWLLAVVTLIEVFISLAAKGYIIAGLEDYSWVLYAAGIGLIVLSLYKAYFIVYEFMHMAYEVKGLGATVLLPMLLLVWAIIAFFQEGGSWGDRREQIKNFNEAKTEQVVKPEGMLLKKEEIRSFE